VTAGGVSAGGHLHVFAGIARGSYGTGFALCLLDEDVRIAARLAMRVGTRATVCDAVRRRLDVATEGLGFGVDSACAYRHWKAEDET
jgi:hypothetical protein